MLIFLLLNQKPKFINYETFQTAYKLKHCCDRPPSYYLPIPMLFRLQFGFFSTFILLDLTAVFDTIDYMIFLLRFKTGISISSMALAASHHNFPPVHSKLRKILTFLLTWRPTGHSLWANSLLYLFITAASSIFISCYFVLFPCRWYLTLYVLEFFSFPT